MAQEEDMTLKRALFMVALVIPPTLALVEATTFGWLRFEWSFKGMLAAVAAYAGWTALLVGVARLAGRWRRRARSTPGQEVTAPPADGPYLAPSPTEVFVGREDEIRRLERALKPGRIPVMAAVVGMEGVGKTELAKVIARRVAGEYRDGVLWADCRHQDVATIASLWAAEYRVQLSGADLDEKIEAWRSLIQDKEALLVFDDVQPGQKIERLLPPPSRNMVLITAEDADHHALRWVEPLQLNPFSDDEALELAARVLGQKRAKGQQADAQRFIGWAGHLPLAVSIGLHVARHAKWKLAQLCEEVERMGSIRAIEESEVPRSVGATCQAAWKNLPAKLQRAFPSLAALSHAPSFDAKAVAAVLSIREAEAGGMLNRLSDWSLVTPVGERWALHPLVRDFVAQRLPAGDPAWGRMAAHYVQVASTAHRLHMQGGEEFLQGLCVCGREWPHIRAGQAWAAAHAEVDEEAAKACSRYPGAAVYCLGLRLPQHDLVTWLEAAVGAARRLEDRQAEGDHLGSLGLAHADLGQFTQAVGYYQRAVGITREIGDRPMEGKWLGKLGLACAELGELREAATYHEQATGIARKVGDRSWEAECLHNLGNAHRGLGQVREAIAYYEQALEIAREIGDRRMEGHRLDDLGSAYAELGAAREALEYYEQALETTGAIDDRRIQSRRLGRLGRVRASLGQVTEAIGYLERALDISREIGDRPAESLHLADLGSAYTSLGALREAIQCYEQALDIAREIGDRPMEAGHLDKLGSALSELGEEREAAGYHEQALQIAWEIDDRQMEGEQLDKLGAIYTALGTPREALACYEQTVQIARGMGDHRLEGERLEKLAKSHHRLRELREAIAYYEQALEIAREMGDRQWEGRVLGTLGLAYASQGTMHQAMACYEQGVEIAREAGDRRGEGSRLGNLGLAHAALGQTNEAIGCYEQVLEIAREIGDRRMEGNALGQLGLSHVALHRPREAIRHYEGGLEIAREIGDRLGEAIRLANLGHVYRQLGDAPRAGDSWEQALAVYEALADPNAERVRGWLEQLSAASVVDAA
jgi:tetratricopeptide (TPR) repeat protein